MAPKRKVSSVRAATPKKKTKHDSSALDIATITKLASDIENKASYNDFTTLLSHYDHIKSTLTAETNEELEQTARHLTASLYKLFHKLFKQGLLVNKKAYDEKKTVLVKWLINKYDTFKDTMRSFIGQKLAYKTSLQVDMLETYLKFIRLESEYHSTNSDDFFFPTLTYRQLIDTLLRSSNGEILPDGSSEDFIVLEFIDKFVKYYDLQFYFFNGLSELLDSWKGLPKSQKRLIFANFFTIIKQKLMFVESAEALKEEKTYIKSKLPSIAYKLSQFKSQYQKALLAALSYPLLSSQIKSVLSILHKRIIPYMAQPSSLMDFLTDAYDVEDDEIIPILTLNSLYELMKRYNLEYPDFYVKLYSLLTPGILYNRYRSRFFRLCDLFLSSTHLSANLVASFIKKLARLSISSTAAGTVIVIPFIYNLLKRHSTCMTMIHNLEAHNADTYSDPFDNEEKDPSKTGAIGSSLWELEALMNHYHPNISTLAQIFKEPFRKPNYNLEDFLDWTYNGLLESEQKRRYKTMAALEYEEWDSLFHQPQKNAYLSGWTL